MRKITQRARSPANPRGPMHKCGVHSAKCGPCMCMTDSYFVLGRKTIKPGESQSNEHTNNRLHCTHFGERLTYFLHDLRATPSGGASGAKNAARSTCTPEPNAGKWCKRNVRLTRTFEFDATHRKNSVACVCFFSSPASPVYSASAPHSKNVCVAKNVCTLSKRPSGGRLGPFYSRLICIHLLFHHFLCGHFLFGSSAEASGDCLCVCEFRGNYPHLDGFLVCSFAWFSLLSVNSE